MKRIIICSALTLLFGSILYAADISIALRFDKGETYLRIINKAKQDIYCPGFQRADNQLLLLFFQDGSLVPDSSWNTLPKSPNLVERDSIGRHIDANSDYESSLNFLENAKSKRFSFDKPGDYYLLCILKKGHRFSDGLFISNVLKLRVVEQEFIKGESILRTSIPGFVLDKITSEVKKLADEDGDSQASSLLSLEEFVVR